MTKKLIETIIPVSKICEEAEKEKKGKTGLPSNVHIWWTRTPYAISRAILFASLIDDPSSHEDIFPDLKSQQKERNRLIKIVEKLAADDCITDKQTVENAKKDIDKATGGVTPVILDPFVGSGSIPVEAHRLGLTSISSDINPIAFVITTVLSDIPARFTNTHYIHSNKEDVVSSYSGIVEDIRFYGKRVIEKAHKKIGHLFPTVTEPVHKEQFEVAAWIWARTIECPNPTCNCQIPLSFCYDLAKKKGHETWVEPIANNNHIRFKIHYGENKTHLLKSKVAHTAVFKCPICGEITTDEYVKECGQKKTINSQLLAIAAERNGKRIYLEATEEQERIALVERPANLPDGELPIFPAKFTPPSFGYLKYVDLFTNRQLVFITTVIELIKEAQIDIEKEAIKYGYKNDKIPFANGGDGARAYSEAIQITLMLSLSKLLDRYSTLCSWNSSSGGAIRNVFSRSAMPMVWDFAEGNPFSSAGGSFYSTLLRVCDSLDCLPFGVNGTTTNTDASLPISVENAVIVTDLPYYDRVPYQELSDYFYIWLKQGLHDIYPDVFKKSITSKNKDMTAFSYRYSGNSDSANAIYLENMRLAISNIYNCASPVYPSIIGFIYKVSSAHNDDLSEWEQFFTSLCDSGFSVTASWPLYGRKSVSESENKNSGMPIMLVVRKEDNKEPAVTRRIFVSSVKKEVPLLLEKMSKMIALPDLRASVIGKALNIFTRHINVIDADGSTMKPYIASRIIEQEIDTYILNYKENTYSDKSLGGN